MINIDDKSVKQAMYMLQGVVLHRGVIDGGHYWAQVR
jgi:ubiquitin C-terminal hydrolase